ncbi:hypothetical protein GCK72_020704 [Caenorhabditis remanei]|uniref:F-box domain-containing protein n=1 Tax=Caenorhabditis remanei TaxID=31234 RepID=A0A6A5GHA1_CAERE|nr:hypothetical protein GCK72_020704 [Caenorhabditis remanei]KAF1754144.1 hypothetical protein GCK72_020704 [Caenorhabditis remanei]
MSQPSLLDMPENVMLKITEAVGFPSIFTLRKTCHNYRNFIDDKTPNSNLTGIFIRVNTKRMYLYYEISGERLRQQIVYNKHPDGCVVNHNAHGMFLRNEKFLLVFLRDFELIIKHQKSALEQFHFHSGGMADDEELQQYISSIFAKTMNILKSRPRPLKVKEFKIDDCEQEHVMSILPFLDANLLKNISMDFDYVAFVVDETAMKLNEIMSLPQWKNATNLDMSYLYVTEPFQAFFGFTRVVICKQTVSGNDLLSVKEKFLSPNNQTEEFSIFYLTFVDGQILGDSITDNCGDQHWYYRTEKNEQILKISNIIWTKTVTVSFVERSDVPENALVLA